MSGEHPTTAEVAAAPPGVPDAVRARAKRLLTIGGVLIGVTILIEWFIVTLPTIFVASITSVVGFVYLLYGWGVRHGALWALRWMPREQRDALEVKAFFYEDEICPGCARHQAADEHYCADCGHAFHPPPVPYRKAVAEAFRRLVKRAPVEPVRSRAFTRRAPHETTDKWLVAGVAAIVIGWIASNKLTSLSRVVMIVAVILPAFLFLLWLRKQDRYEQEPMNLLLIAFGWGMAAGVFVKPLNTLFISFTGMAQIAGFTEEVAKAAIVVLFATHRVVRKEVNGPTDGLVYAAAAGLGFAAMENFSYVFKIMGMGGTAIDGLIIRSGGIISHMMYSGIAGAFLGLMALRNGRVGPRDLMVAFVPAAVPHMINNTPLLGITGLGGIIAAWWFFKALADALRDEAAWGYASGEAPVEAA